jgi:hypothetical protein
MAIACPKCPVVMEDFSGVWNVQGEPCPMLAGTKYAHHTEWYPVLSDAAPADVQLLPTGYRADVEAAIAAKAKP